MTQELPEPDIVKRARRVLANRRPLRWKMLVLAATYFGFTIWAGTKMIRYGESILNRPDVTEGFVKGFGLGFVVVAFGSAGAFCIAKALIGFQKDFDEHAMLVKYHEELKTLMKNKDLSNKASEATSEPTPSAVSSSPQG